MNALRSFLARKNIVISAKRYGIDALGAMAQGLFASLLIGTILNTAGTQLGLSSLVSVGKYASGPPWVRLAAWQPTAKAFSGSPA